MGLFDGLDIDVDWDQVEEYNPNVTPGPHPFLVSNFVVEQKNSVPYLVISYLITDGSQKGKTQKEYKRIPLDISTEQGQRDAQYIQSRMISLGIPKDRINKVESEDVIGIEGIVTLVPQKNDPRYNNVAKVTVLNKDNEVPSLPGPVAKAPVSEDDPFF